MKAPRFDLIIEARAVLAGIPEDRYARNLMQFFEVKKEVFQKRPSANDCNTLACAGGWLALYPPFVYSKKNREGLSLSNEHSLRSHATMPVLAWNEGYLTGTRALAEFFDLTSNYGTFLFGPRRVGKFDEWNPFLDYPTIIDVQLSRCGRDGDHHPEHNSDKQIVLKRFDALIAAFERTHRDQVYAAKEKVFKRLGTI